MRIEVVIVVIIVLLLINRCIDVLVGERDIFWYVYCELFVGYIGYLVSYLIYKFRF